MSGGSPADWLRAAAQRIDDLAAADARYKAEGVMSINGGCGDTWLTVVGPHVAPVLSAWLRAEAADAAFVFQQNYSADARAERLGGANGQTYVMARSTLTHALALADLLLGPNPHTGDPNA